MRRDMMESVFDCAWISVSKWNVSLPACQEAVGSLKNLHACFGAFEPDAHQMWE